MWLPLTAATIDLQHAVPIAELAGIIGDDIAAYNAAVRRIRTWEHGLGSLKVQTAALKCVALICAYGHPLLVLLGWRLVFQQHHPWYVYDQLILKGLVCFNALLRLQSLCVELYCLHLPYLSAWVEMKHQRSLISARLESWLQPLPPADILVAATAAFRKGGRLRPDFGVGLSVDGGGPLGLHSSYAPWILADMSQWARTGITQVTSVVNGFEAGWKQVRVTQWVSCADRRICTCCRPRLNSDSIAVLPWHNTGTSGLGVVSINPSWGFNRI